EVHWKLMLADDFSVAAFSIDGRELKVRIAFCREGKATFFQRRAETRAVPRTGTPFPRGDISLLPLGLGLLPERFHLLERRFRQRLVSRAGLGLDVLEPAREAGDARAERVLRRHPQEARDIDDREEN